MIFVTELEPLPGRQQFVAVAVAVAMLVLVLELVRRRKLREEYSWLWVVTALGLIVLALNGDVLVLASRWIGAAASTSTLFFGAIVFLLLVALQFSVHLSKLAQRQKTLAQRLALLERELEERRGAGGTTIPLREPPPVGAARRDAQDEIA
jgi:hypothetical protein